MPTIGSLRFPRPRTARRPITLSVILLAVALACVDFILSFNRLGGTLGGFKNDEFATLVHTNMILSGLQPLRDFEEAGLRAVWPSLTFELPALMERVWGRDLFVHACLTLGALALCRFVVLLLARGLSRSVIVGLLAALLVFVSLPEPYNYPKVLVLTVAALLMTWTVRNPDRGRLTVLAAWTVIAILFRNDFGVYVLVGSVAALIAVEPRPWRVPARRLMVYAIAGAVLSIPSLLWIQNHRGLLLYLSEIRESSGAEFTTRRLGGWPVVHLTALTDRDSLVALCYYGYWILPAIALMVLIVRSRGRTSVSAELGVGWGLVTMALVVNQFFLRSNLQARLGDPSTSVVLVAAWTAGAALGFETPWVRRLIQVTPAAVLVVLCAALIRANDIPSRFSGTGVAQSLEATWRRFEVVKQELRSLPPVQWGERPTTGNMAVARYLNECLTPNDYVLVGMYADDIVAYSRRRFAGGQAYFDGSFFRSESAQRRAVRRLMAQSVPVAITTPDYRDEFVSDYPLVARYFLERYRQVGFVSGGDGHTDVLVWVEADRSPVTRDSLLGFPCFR